jgi:uncharacterized protein
LTCLGRIARAASSMRWRRVVFGHWPVRDPFPLLERLPRELDLDRHRGCPWISVVALAMHGPAPLGRYQQINVRTYVRGPRGPGIFVLEARVDRLRALAPRLLGQPYRHDPRAAVALDDDALEVRRGDEVLTGRLLDGGAHPERAAPGSLDEFLVERYWNYARVPLAGLLAVRVAHPAWELAPAELTCPALGPSGRAHLSPGVDVVVAEVVRLAADAPRERASPAPRPYREEAALRERPHSRSTS